MGDASGLLDGILEDGEGHELSHGDRDRSSHGRGASSPKSVEALLLDDPPECIEDALVVPPLLGGEGGVALESHEDKVRGVPDAAAEHSGSYRESNFVHERKGLAWVVLLPLLREVGEGSEPGGPVGDLPEDR